MSSLRQVIHAAAPCPIDLKRRLFDWLGPVIYEFYGATEGGGTLARPEDWLAHPGTVGRPWAGADVKVLDDDGNEVPPGTVGTVYLKLMGEFAYKGDPEKTAANRHGDYFTVGDMGELDDDGFLYLRDRKIDMIISGGVNIYPAEVEAALLSHPAVGDAAVFGIPHDDWGEEVKAVVEPAAGRRAVARRSPTTCSRTARRMLARYKLPAQHRLHRRDAPRPERQALQAHAPRPVLGRARAQPSDRAVADRRRRPDRRPRSAWPACPSKRGSSASPTIPTSRRGCSAAGARTAARCSSRGAWCARSACTRAPTTSSCRPAAGSGPGRTATCRCSGKKDADVPGYGVGQVDLPEGPRIQAILLGGPDDFEIGMELEIDLETLRDEPDGDEVVIYRFRPVEAERPRDAARAEVRGRRGRRHRHGALRHAARRTR